MSLFVFWSFTFLCFFFFFFFYWKISTLIDATLKIPSILFFNSLWLHLRLFKFITDLYFHSFYYDGTRCGSLSYVSLWFIVFLDSIRFENTLITVVFSLVSFRLDWTFSMPIVLMYVTFYLFFILLSIFSILFFFLTPYFSPEYLGESLSFFFLSIIIILKSLSYNSNIWNVYDLVDIVYIFLFFLDSINQFI